MGEKAVRKKVKERWIDVRLEGERERERERDGKIRGKREREIERERTHKAAVIMGVRRLAVSAF